MSVARLFYAACTSTGRERSAPEAFRLWRRSASQPERFSRYIHLRRGRCILEYNQSDAAFRSYQSHFSTSIPGSNGLPRSAGRDLKGDPRVTCPTPFSFCCRYIKAKLKWSKIEEARRDVTAGVNCESKGWGMENEAILEVWGRCCFRLDIAGSCSLALFC